MGAEWQQCLFENAPLQILDGDRGKNYPNRSEFTSSGHCIFLNTGNVTQSGFNLSELAFISKVRDELLRKGKLQRHDVVLTTRGTVGNVAYFNDQIPFNHIRINSGMVILRADQKHLDSRFLYLFLRSRLFSAQVEALRTGSAQPQLPIRDINKVAISLPNLNDQKSIAHILGSLDDKIELNHQMNATLESMAQALFKSWFVDFDPVIDNALAAGNPIPEALKAKAATRQALGEKRKPLPETIRQQFPNSFEFSEEVGWVPEGWEVLPLDDTIDLIGGGTPKTSMNEYWGGDIPWFSVVDTPNTSDVFVIETEKTITQLGLDNSSTKLLPRGTTIISARGTVGKCAVVGAPIAMNQSCYGIRGKNSIADYYTYYTILLRVSDLQQRGHGSVFSTITRDTFKTLKTPNCGVKLSHLFDETIDPYFERILQNSTQSTSLSKLRDTLLPKLLSGELRIPDAEKLVANVQ